jgi:hypothetical protein
MYSAYVARCKMQVQQRSMTHNAVIFESVLTEHLMCSILFPGEHNRTHTTPYTKAKLTEPYTLRTTQAN